MVYSDNLNVIQENRSHYIQASYNLLKGREGWGGGAGEGQNRVRTQQETRKTRPVLNWKESLGVVQWERA